MKRYLKTQVSCITVIMFIFAAYTSVMAQNCYNAVLSDQDIDFPLSGGSTSITVSFPQGCSGPTITTMGEPSWLNVSISGTTINLSCISGSYDYANVAVKVNGNIVSGFFVERGTPPQQPCTISGLPSTISMDPLGETLNYTLTFSNCSAEYLTFTTNGTDPIPSNSWLSVTQLSNTSIRLVAGINDTSVLRSIIVIGTKPTGSTYISAQITQDKCEQNWYVDEDNDSFGNAFAAPVVSCTNPSYQYQAGGQTVYVNYVTNNNDLCPEVSGTSQGCPSGQVPEDMNWITAKAYNLNGTLKASTKSYFDNLGKSIQSQSVDFKTNRTWASQTLYDAQGRPALNTLSAPINSLGTFTYKSDFIRDSGNNTYDNADFEINPESPSTVGTASNTLGWYYSTSNTNSYQQGNSYQDITSYPFSRTIYSDLNPGAALKTIGGNKQGGEWKQGYSFSMLAGQELSQSVAFGDENYDTNEPYNYKIIKTISKNVHGNEVVIFTDTDGKTLGAARVGGTTVRNTVITIGEQGFVDVHVPTGTTGFTIDGVSGITTEVYNLITEQITSTATGSLTPGFYRISITNLENYNPSSSAVTITCKENYYDYSLNEYDEAGRLIASYQPVGATKAQKPVTTYSYNALGQLESTTSPDEGTAHFKYRKDGQIRFSTNSKQLSDFSFSYTNYDDLGRPIESGVATGNFFTLNADASMVTSGFQEEKQETKYDYLESADLTFLSGVHSSYANPTFLAGNVAKTSNDNSTTYYSYDVYGRVTWMVQSINGLTGAKTIDYEYDPITGAVTKVYYQRYTSADRFIHRYTYDNINNSLIKVETSTDNSNFTTHADYEYYETGALRRIELAILNGIPLQGIDYVYNLNGQLKSINHPSLTSANDPGGDSNDLFGMQIDYNTDDYQRTLSNITSPSYGEDQFNGNIKGIRWNNKTFGNTEKTYSYYYNKNNWLENAVYGQYALSGGDGSKVNIMDDAVYDTGTTNLNARNSVTLLPGFHAKSGSTLTAKIVTGSPSNFQSQDYNVFDITYDANGNIRTLNRNKQTESSQNKMDQLGYVYNPEKPNQLVRVDDAAGDVIGAEDIGDQDGTNYQYNEIGQLVKNIEENIDYIYNASGLVKEVKKDGQTLVKFFYNDRGHRVKKQSYVGANLNRTDYYVRDASGSVMAIYEDGSAKEYPIYGSSRLGVYNSDGSSYYQLTDHLGNVRAVVTRQSGNAVALVNTDYYPFGMPMPGRINGANGYRYAYQGQEKDIETQKEAFELRLWDSRIGRWLTTDPAGQYASPYLGMGNNPISRVDPDGGQDYSGDPSPGFFDRLFGKILSWLRPWHKENYKYDNFTEDERNVLMDLDQANFRAAEEFSRNIERTVSHYDLLGLSSAARLTMAMDSDKSIGSFYDDYNYMFATDYSVYGDSFNTVLLFGGAATSGGSGSIFSGASNSIGKLSIPVYRVYGAQAGRFGRSWTFINPKLYGSTFRNFAGLPTNGLLRGHNSGTLMIKGTVQLKNISGFRMALPIKYQGTFGRLVPELLIDNSWEVIKWLPSNVTRVSF